MDRMAELVNIMADNWIPKYERMMKVQMNNNNGNFIVNDKCTNVVNDNSKNDKYIFFNYADSFPKKQFIKTELIKKDCSIQCELHTPQNKNIQCNLSLSKKVTGIQKQNTNNNNTVVVASVGLPILKLDLSNGENKSFLVDTGSCFSIMQHYNGTLNKQDKPIMTAVNGSQIGVKGTVQATIFINDVPYEHKFVIADVSHNILGYDFWTEHELVIRPSSEGVEVFPIETAPTVKPCPALRSRFGTVNGIFRSNREERASELNRRMHLMESISNRLIVEGEEPDTINLDEEETNVNAVEVPSVMKYEIVNGCPYYKPLQLHADRTSLVNAVMDKQEDDYLLYAEHLDMYQGLADSEKEKLVIQLIKDRSAEDIQHLATKFVKCFNDNPDFNKPSKIPIVHHIEFSEEIKYKQPFIYKVNLAYHEKVKKQLDELERQGIIEIGVSEYAAPLCVVPKANTTELRLCGDFRAINACTRPDRYPLPRIDEIKQKVTGYVFSVLDLKNGFYQIPVALQDKQKTAMQTPFGLYVYNRMPFGLRNAPPTFQRFMNKVVEKLEHVIVYVDDIIIFSNSYDEHVGHLHKLFERLEYYEMIVNFKKSHFFQTEVTYLGFVINARGYRPSQVVIPKFDKLEPPVDKEGVQKFMGIVNYYREHMPHMAEFGTKMYDLVKKYVKFRWTPEHQKEFEVLKKMCQERLLLVPFRVGTPAEVYTDASCVACGAVLIQDHKLVQCFSKSFNPTQQHYSTFDRECYGMVLAVKYFRHLLVGTSFVVYTDHKPLTKWLSKPPVNDRHARWITQVQDLIQDIQYVKGVDNVLADLLSRPRGLLKSVKDELPVKNMNTTVASINEGENTNIYRPVIHTAVKQRKWQPRHSVVDRLYKYEATREAAGTPDYRYWYCYTLKPKFHDIRKRVRDKYGKKISKRMDMQQYGNFFGLPPEIIRDVAPEWAGNVGEDADVSYIPTISFNEITRDRVITRAITRQQVEEQNRGNMPVTASGDGSLHYTSSMPTTAQQPNSNLKTKMEKTKSKIFKPLKTYKNNKKYNILVEESLLENEVNDTTAVKEIINETIDGSKLNQQTINIFEQVLDGNDLTHNPLLDLTPQLQSSLIQDKAPEASSGVGQHSIVEFAEYNLERRQWREGVDTTDHRQNAFSEIRDQVSDASTDFESASIIQNNERLKRPKPLSLIFNDIDEQLDGTRCTWFDHTPFVDQHAKMPKHPNCQEDLFFTMNNYIRDPHPEQGCPYDIHNNEGQTTTIIDVDKKLVDKDKMKGFCLADLVRRYPKEANDHHSEQSEETIINPNDNDSPPLIGRSG